MAVISSIQIDTKSASKSIADLEKELADTNEQLKQVDINSDAFTDLQKKAASVQGELNDINQKTATLSKGLSGFGENLAKTTGAITGGITAATAAMQMMGVENENVVNGIAKLQQLMSFTQGISALKDLSTGLKGLTAVVDLSSKSFKGLKGAIAATGIGALVVVLGLVIENWDMIIAKVNEFIDVAKISEKVTAGLDATVAGLKQTIVAIGNAITTYITAPFKTISAAISAYSDTEGSVLDKLKSALKASKSEIVDAGKDVVSGFKEIGTKAASAYNSSIDEQNAKAEAKRKAVAIAAAKERAEAEAKAYSEALSAANKELQLANAKAEAELYGDEKAILAEKIKNQQEYITKLKEGTVEYYNALKTLYDLQNSATQPETVTDSQPTSSEGEDQSEWQKKLTEAQDYYNSLTELEYAQYAAFQQQQAEKLAALQDYYDKGLLSEEQFNTAKAALYQKDKQARLQMSATAATGIADILNSVASTMDQTNEKQFKAMKAMQISAATIQMMVGITTALSGAFTTKTGPWDIALAVIQAASIAASGGAQIASIAKQKYDSSSSSSTASVSSASLASTVTTPAQYSSAVDSVNLESAVTDTKVYVVESDINQTGSRVSVQETENRY